MIYIENNKWLAEFGSRLRAERERQGLTQKKVAQLAQTAPEYIAQLEKGARNPSLRTIVNIISALDISADSLIFGKAEGMEGLINDFNGFLLKRDVEQVSAYFDIVRYHSKYVDSYTNSSLENID